MVCCFVSYWVIFRSCDGLRLYPPANHLPASGHSVCSKYRTVALVKGLQKVAIPSCHFFSPTTANRSMFVEVMHRKLRVRPQRTGSPSVEAGHAEQHTQFSVLFGQSFKLRHKVLVVFIYRLSADASGEKFPAVVLSELNRRNGFFRLFQLWMTNGNLDLCVVRLWDSVARCSLHNGVFAGLPDVFHCEVHEDCGILVTDPGDCFGKEEYCLAGIPMAGLND